MTTLCDHIAWRIHSWYSSSTKQLSPLYRFRSYVNSQYYRWRSFADSSLFVFFLKIPSYFVWKLTVIWKSFFVWHNLLTKYSYIAWQKHSCCRKPFFRKSCVTALRDNIAWRKHSRPSSSIVHRPSSIVQRPGFSTCLLGLLVILRGCIWGSSASGRKGGEGQGLWGEGGLDSAACKNGDRGRSFYLSCLVRP